MALWWAAVAALQEWRTHPVGHLTFRDGVLSPAKARAGGWRASYGRRAWRDRGRAPTHRRT